MNILIKRILILITLITLFSCGAPGKPNNTIVSVKTTLGEIKLILYDDTPLHRNNFITLINSGLYDNVSFHRVIKDFMIQTGDLSTRPAGSSAAPDSLSGYTIPAEINRQHFHKKGALAAARQGNEINPEMRSSGTQFYIVQGTRYNDQDLNMAEQKINSNIKQSVFNRFIHQISDSLKTSGVPATDAQIQDLASMKMFEYLTN